MGKRIGAFGLVNYRRHPKDQNYLVFNFNSLSEAEIFERELNKSKVRFEKDQEEVEGAIMYLFAVQETNLDEALAANGIVAIANKRPLLKNKFLRYFILFFIGILLTLAVVGYVKNPTKMKRDVENIPSDTLTFVE